MPDDLEIGPLAEVEVAEAAAIYGHYVETSLSNFEEVRPSAAELGSRFAALRAQSLPVLGARRDGRLLGYAYLGPYQRRAAYRYSLEVSVYVAADAHRQGVGRGLLGALIDWAEAAGYRRLIAVIGDTDNKSSIGLHAALGFGLVGVLPAVGWKQGRWVDVVLMERAVGEGDKTAPGDLLR